MTTNYEAGFAPPCWLKHEHKSSSGLSEYQILNSYHLARGGHTGCQWFRRDHSGHSGGFRKSQYG